MRVARSLAVALIVACAAIFALAAPALAAEGMTRERAAELYEQTELDKLVPVGWTGSVKDCVVGTESQASIDATFSTLNAIREFAGIGPVVQIEEKNRMALAAALMASVDPMKLEHYPEPDAPCYSEDGAMGSANSNLAGLTSGADAIWAYVNEGPDFGHRRFVLNPGTLEMGTGSTGKANALYVDGYRDGSGVDAMPPDSAVAWPPAGPFPSPWLPEHKDQWSISVGNAANAESISTRNATVTAKLDGSAIEVGEVVKFDDLEYGVGIGRAIGWELQLPRTVSSGEHAITIRIDGVTENGDDFQIDPYTIETFVPEGTDPEPPDPEPSAECLEAKSQLKTARRKLAQAKRSGRNAKIKRARRAVARAKAAVAATC